MVKRTACSSAKKDMIAFISIIENLKEREKKILRYKSAFPAKAKRYENVLGTPETFNGRSQSVLVNLCVSRAYSDIVECLSLDQRLPG